MLSADGSRCSSVLCIYLPWTKRCDQVHDNIRCIESDSVTPKLAPCQRPLGLIHGEVNTAHSAALR
jgi:hypothetical protein